MPRLTNSLSKYRKHRASGQALVTLSGKDHYLGRHGTIRPWRKRVSRSRAEQGQNVA